MSGDVPGTTLLDGLRLLRMGVTDGIFEIRALHTSKGTVSGYFTSCEIAAQQIERILTPLTPPAIYMTLNPVSKALLARANNRLLEFARHTTADQDILRRVSFVIDTDAVRPAGVSSTEREHLAALRVVTQIIDDLREMGWPEPARCSSGNGGHAIYAVDLPNDAATLDLFKRALAALARTYNTPEVTVDQTVFNAARIWKVYGTWARKGDSTADRPHRMAEIQDLPPELVCVTVDQLSALALPPDEHHTTASPSKYDVPAILARLTVTRSYEPDSDGTIKHEIHCPWKVGHTTNVDSGTVFMQRGSGELIFKCQHSHCHDRTWDDLRDHLGVKPRGRDYLQIEIDRERNRRDARRIVDEEEGEEYQIAHRLQQEHILREARRRVEMEDVPKIDSYDICTLREELAKPDEDEQWRVEQLQPAGSNVVLAAQYKAGKTTLMGNLTRAIVDHELFLGEYAVTPLPDDKCVGIVDTEMDRKQLRRWLREQGIKNDDRVVLMSLVGAVHGFDLLNTHVRSQWVERMLRDRIGYLVLDCLRPVLDAIGLDEHREVGRFLTAFDRLKREAKIDETCVVHHMGHAEERSRGDSRLRDWPAAEWLLVRGEDADQQESDGPRFIKAYGRDVCVNECALAYDPLTRRLTVVGGSRKEKVVHDALVHIAEVLVKEDQLSGRQIVDMVRTEYDVSKHTAEAALKRGVARGVVVISGKGARNAKLHTLAAGMTPEEVRRSLARVAVAAETGLVM